MRRVCRIGGQVGTTLVELVVAISIFAVIIIGIFYIWSNDQQAYLQGSAAADTQQDARAAMEQLAREIRLAGYDPCRYVPAVLPVGVNTNCGAPPGGSANRSAFDPVQAGTYPIQSYAVDSIEIHMDRDWSGNAHNADENIVFSYDSGAKQILRDDVMDGRPAQVLAQNIESFSFEYLNASGAAPVDRNDIRVVRILLTAQEAFQGSPLIVRLQSDVRLRDR